MDIKYYASCECCNFKALSKNKWDIHLQTNKHKRNGKSKSEFNFCKICGYWSLYEYGLNVHKIVYHGNVEDKRKAPYYCECCNKAFFRKLYYDRHMSAERHSKIHKKYNMLNNHIFADIDETLIEKNYLAYVDDIKTKIETSLFKTKIKCSKFIQKN